MYSSDAPPSKKKGPRLERRPSATRARVCLCPDRDSSDIRASPNLILVSSRGFDEFWTGFKLTRNSSWFRLICSQIGRLQTTHLKAPTWRWGPWSESGFWTESLLTSAAGGFVGLDVRKWGTQNNSESMKARMPRVTHETGDTTHVEVESAVLPAGAGPGVVPAGR